MASEITVDPMVASFVGPFDQISECHVKVTNIGSEPVTIKIKTNDNNIFKLRPVYAVIELGQEQFITFRCSPLTETPMKPNLRFAIVYTRTPMEVTDAKRFWLENRGIFTEQVDIPVQLGGTELDILPDTEREGEGPIPKQQKAEAEKEAADEMRMKKVEQQEQSAE